MSRSDVLHWRFPSRFGRCARAAGMLVWALADAGAAAAQQRPGEAMPPARDAAPVEAEGALPVALPNGDAEPVAGGAGEGTGSGAAADAWAPALPGWLAPRLDTAVEAAIAEGATSGAALVVGYRGRIAFSRTYGRVDWAEDAAPVTDSTLWDVASLTKVVGTTTLAMLLWEEGTLDLEAPVHRYLPDWPSTGLRGRITVGHLLRHTAGFPASMTLWRTTRGKDAYRAALAGVPLRSRPGRSEVYSDLGMILLGMVLESAAGEPLDVLVERRVLAPLEMRDSRYLPLEAGVDPSLVVATEWDRGFRGRHLRGEVHDPNAGAMGGVAGHAGLFASARDLARFASALLWGRPASPACPATVERFTERSGPDRRFALGWEMPSRRSMWSDHLGERAFGHTGYTGTSLWFDPDDDLFVILLTSRVNPSPNMKHVALRKAVHAAVRSAVVDPFVFRPAEMAVEGGGGAAVETVDGRVCPAAG